MPNVTTPPAPYPLAEWEIKPRNPTGEQEHEKYDYVTGETLESIAQRITQPGRTVQGGEIAALNWGTIVQSEINYYLRDYNGSKTDATDTHYVLAGDDRQPWLWVPKVAPPAPVGKFRSPGKHDVGHVAPDHEPALHINTLVVPPVYAITLELGDIDALFPPLDPRTDSARPWTKEGVQQRLQALGYMYTPLRHSEVSSPPHWAAERAWWYYASVHEQKRGPNRIRSNAARMALLRGGRACELSNTELLAILKSEIQNNIVTRSFPQGGAVFQNSKLPPRDQIGIIRFPGGYCFTFPRARQQRRWTVSSVAVPGQERRIDRTDVPPSDADRGYDFELGGDRFLIEEKLLSENPLIGAIPVVACVHKLLPDGRRQPAEGVSVYFQLVEPEVLDPAQSTHSPFCAPILRNEVMDYSKDRSAWEGPNPGTLRLAGGKSKTVNDQQWAALQAAARDVNRQHPAAGIPRTTYLNSRALPPEFAPWQVSAGVTGAKADYKAAIKDLLNNDPGADNPGTVRATSGTKPVSDEQWTLLRTAKEDVLRQHPNTGGPRDKYLDTLPLPPEFSGWSTDVGPPETNPAYKLAIDDFRVAVTELLKHTPPYTISNAGQKKFMDDLMRQVEGDAARVDPSDPQRRNSPGKWGGKAGLPVAGNVFEVGVSRPGLHTCRGPHHRDYGTLTPAAEATPDGDRHKYAVRAKTNAKGYAGVIFLPSRCGGDTYRLRAYVGPETLEFDGTDPDGPVVDTGTLVVWRNVRMHRYVQKPTPPRNGWSQAVKNLLNYAQSGKHHKPGTPVFDAMALGSPLINVSVLPGDPPEGPYRPTVRSRIDVQVNTLAEKNYRPEGSSFISLQEQLRRCYCELIADCHGRETMDPTELGNAIEAGIQAIERDWDLPDRIIWRELYFHDFSSPFMLNQRSFEEYNAIIGQRADQATLARMDQVLGGQMVGYFNYLLIDTILGHFSDFGAYPGLTLVQVPRSETWDARAICNGTVTTSGYGAPSRVAILSHTTDVYRGDDFCYSATSNAAHELGHVLALPHQDTYPGGDKDMHQPQPTAKFAKPKPTDCPCVQGYYGCFGEYCGKCILALRGWRVKSKSNPTGV